MNVAQAVGTTLADLGVDYAFGVVGSGNFHVTNALVGAGVRFVAEGFPDRRYLPDGRLVARSEPDAVLHDPAEVEAQVVRLVERGLVQTLCIHGDDPRSVANAEAVRAALARHAIATRRF